MNKEEMFNYLDKRLGVNTKEVKDIKNYIETRDEIYEYYENDDFKDYRAYDSYFDGYVYLSNYIERNGLGCIVEELEVIDEG